MPSLGMGQIVAAMQALGDATGGASLMALLFASTLTMAILQAFKDITTIRESFQREWISWWLERKDSRQERPNWRERRKIKRDKTAQAAAAKQKHVLSSREELLIDLATGGDDKALYSLPTEQLVAQMTAASQIVLDYPGKDHYSQLLRALALGAELEDISAVIGIENPRQLAASGEPIPVNYIDARNRVSHRIQRNLDGLQISMSYRWQLNLQIASIILSIATIEISLWVLPTGSKGFAAYVFGALIGLVGGYFAPVTRDLFVALQKLRKP